MRAIGISFLLFLTGFCLGNPEGVCSSVPGSATGARLRLDEHYTGAAVPGVPTTVDAVSPEPSPPFRSGRSLLILLGIALLPTVYVLRRKSAGKEDLLPEKHGTAGSPPLPDLFPELPEVPEEEPEESWPDLEEHVEGPDPGEVPAGEVAEASPGPPPEELFSLSRIRCRAAETGEVDVGRLMYLLEAVRKPYDHSRLIYWMGRLGVKEALPRILRELAHPNASVRMAAAAALVHLKSDRVEERMIEMAEERDPHVRRAALLVLSRIGSARCYRIVRQSSWDFEPEVREAAAIALGRLQVPDADFDLRQILNDFEEKVRLRAVRASGQLREGLQQEGG